MRIAIGCDHAAWQLKDHIVKLLGDLGHEAINKGTDGPDSVDYPDFAAAVCQAVTEGSADRGIPANHADLRPLVGAVHVPVACHGMGRDADLGAGSVDV